GAGRKPPRGPAVLARLEGQRRGPYRVREGRQEPPHRGTAAALAEKRPGRKAPRRGAPPRRRRRAGRRPAGRVLGHTPRQGVLPQRPHPPPLPAQARGSVRRLRESGPPRARRRARGRGRGAAGGRRARALPAGDRPRPGPAGLHPRRPGRLLRQVRLPRLRPAPQEARGARKTEGMADEPHGGPPVRADDARLPRRPPLGAPRAVGRGEAGGEERPRLGPQGFLPRLGRPAESGRADRRARGLRARGLGVDGVSQRGPRPPLRRRPDRGAHRLQEPGRGRLGRLRGHRGGRRHRHDDGELGRRGVGRGRPVPRRPPGEGAREGL
ncbi:MAG: hypothetical protein AVDCRST_MAG05-2175, partial [uncultured Rubrobacteraceae bacterium]